MSELESAPAADVIIDFSNVVTFDAVVAYVERTGAALVSGTTGYTPEQVDRLRELGQNARVMHSGNYSIGIAALRHLVAQATRELPGFDCEIVETHHNQKVDAPSGTAKLLLDAVVEAEPEAGYHPVYGREGMCGARDPKEIGMHSLRGGTVAGVHEVSFSARTRRSRSRTAPRAVRSSSTAPWQPRRSSSPASLASIRSTRSCLPNQVSTGSTQRRDSK